MPREKARTPARKGRPASKGPKKRVGGNHGNGKKFQPGSNSHDGAVFRRGPDDIPRGSATLMFRVIPSDKRQAIYDSLCKLVDTPRGALEFLREVADRTEGKPTQKHEVGPVRSTFFGPAPDPASAPLPGPPGPPGARALRPGPASIAEVVMTDENGTRFRPL